MLPIQFVKAATLNQAVSQASRLYGDDATVLNQSYDEDGVTLAVCEVDTAGVDKSLIEKAIKASQEAKAQTSVEAEVSNIDIDDSVLQVLSILRDGGKVDINQSAEAEDESDILDSLLSIGFEYKFANTLLKSLANEKPNLKLEDVLNHIDSQLPIAEDIIAKGGWISMMGTPGVGKTTTISKLTALLTKFIEKDKIALVTVDTFRLGAVQQLRDFANLLGVECFVCESPAELLELTKKLSDKQVVLLDTAGKSQKDSLLHQELSNYLNGSIRNLLVMSAASQFDVLEKTIEEFMCFGIDGLVLTKTDESLKLGAAVTAIVNSQIPCQYLTTGQQVPADILKVKEGTILGMACNLADVNWARR